MTPCPLGQAGQCYCAKQLNSFAAAGPSRRIAVLLLAHGSPENPSQVPEFLSYVTGGRPLPPAVVEEIRHRYSLIGFSPLPCWTLLQADQLSQLLQMPVFVGMRNWKPFIADAVKAIASGRYERVIAICLAPQNSRTSVGLYRSAVSGDGNLPFKMDFVEEWHDHPLLAKAFAEELRGLGEGVCRSGSPTACDLYRAQRAAAHHHGRRSLREASQGNRPAGSERSRPRRRRLDFRLPESGHVRWCMDRAYSRRNNSEPQSQRPQRSVHSPRRLPLRSRRSALRHRHLLQAVRRKRRPAPMASRIAERIEDVDFSPGGLGAEPGGST